MEALIRNNKKAIYIGSIVVIVIALAVMLGLLTTCSSDSAEVEAGSEHTVERIGEPDQGSTEPILADEGGASVEAGDLTTAEDPNQSGSSETALSSGNADSGASTVRSPQPSANSDSAAKQNNASSPGSSASQKKWVEETKQVWVEDRTAWTEQVPVYSTKEVSICNVCGADITGNTSAHSKAHMLAGEGSGHYSEVRKVVTGYNTVNHPAEGHYETRVTGGHWE